jgi:NTE family protein
LALGGGAALGLSEIGIIRWMEDNHVPVDRIAGTSMGSIIGAMYATGMSSQEIEKFAEQIKWDEAFRAEPAYPELSYRRKQDRRDYQIEPLLGLKHGLTGPNGFNPGQRVELLLDRIAYSEYAIHNFDELPIPFRCVATDMLSGQAVVLRDGPLGQAVRASMAIPGVFTPVEVNGRVLADGGMVQNVPVETVREMGVDAVIAVQLQTPPGTREQLETLTGMLSRAVSVMITQNEERSMALADAKVTVDTTGFDVTDYGRVKEFIALGYKAAASNSTGLLRYAIQDDAWKQYLSEREARRHRRSEKVAAIAIQVTGSDADTDRRIKNRLTSALHEPLDLDQLDQQLIRIAGEGQFDRLGYEGFLQNGVPALQVTTHEKNYGPPFVDLAVNVDGSGVAAFDFSAGARVTFMDIAHHGGEWRNDFLFGSSNLAASEFYQPIAGSHFFAAPYVFVSKYARNSFSGDTRVAVFGDERGGGGLDFGHDTRRSEFRIGYEIFSGKLSPLIGGEGLPIVNGSTGEFRARYIWDGQDSPSVPAAGSRVVATVSHVLQSPDLAHPITQLEVQSSNFMPVGGKTSLFISASGGTTFGGSAGPFQVFALGGPFHLGAYLPQEFLGNHYAYTSFGFRRSFYRLPSLVGGKIYWGGWYEAGTAFGKAGDDPGPVVVRGTLNIGLIADTIVGPIAVAGSVSPTGQSRINFTIGRLF